MKTITIITLQNVRNYGSVLQAWATRKIFESLGCKVDFFNYMRGNNATPWSRIKVWTKQRPWPVKIVMGILLYPTFLLQDRRFKRFLGKHLNVQKEVCTTMDDFKKLRLTSDIYCTGSDQTWNSGWNEGMLPGISLYLMTRCKVVIMANSTFSFWAACLNKNNPMVIIPKDWGNTGIKVECLYRKGWIIV